MDFGGAIDSPSDEIGMIVNVAFGFRALALFNGAVHEMIIEALW